MYISQTCDNSNETNNFRFFCKGRKSFKKNIVNEKKIE